MVTWLRSGSPFAVVVYRFSSKSYNFSLRYGDLTIFKMAATDQHEISGQYLDNESVSGDAVLWRHNKSKMADDRHFEDR